MREQREANHPLEYELMKHTGWRRIRSADIFVFRFTGLSSPVFEAPGGWKIARTRRLENLRWVAFQTGSKPITNHWVISRFART
jgi:hypothetical protein